MASLAGEFMDFIVAGYKADPEAMKALILAGEGGFKPLLLSIVNKISIPEPYSLLIPFVQAGANQLADHLIATYSSDELYVMVGDFLAAEAHNVGG